MAHPEAMGPNLGSDTPGRKRMNAVNNAYALRLMEKPVSESLNSDPAARLFHDPPELIQMAFGGRNWFHEVGNHGVHRVGLFRGLGWQLGELIARQDERGINAVRITGHRTEDPAKGYYNIEFLHRTLSEGNVGGVTEEPVFLVSGVLLEDLKATYARILGEHAI